MLLYLKELGFVVAIVVWLVVLPAPPRLCQTDNWMLQRDIERNYFNEQCSYSKIMLSPFAE